MLALVCASALGCAKSREQWQRELADDEPFTRYLAALALAEDAREPPPRAFAVLVEAAQDGDPRSRAAADRALRRHVRGAAMAYVDAMVEQSTSPTADVSRSYAGLRALGDAAVDAIAAEVSRPRVVERQEVWNVLASWEPRGRMAVTALLSHVSVRARVGAATALGSLGQRGDEALPALWKGLADEDPYVVRACIKAIVSIDPTATRLRERLSCAASDANAEELSEPCAQTLLAMAKTILNANPGLRRPLLELLRMTADRGAEQVAIALLQRPETQSDPDARRFLVRILYETPPEALLSALASDPRCDGFAAGLSVLSAGRRARSALALAQAGVRGVPALDALARASTDPVPVVHFTAQCGVLRVAIELGLFPPFHRVQVASEPERAR